MTLRCEGAAHLEHNLGWSTETGSDAADDLDDTHDGRQGYERDNRALTLARHHIDGHWDGIESANVSVPLRFQPNLPEGTEQRPFRKEPDVWTFWIKMPIEGKARQEHILDPPVVWRSYQDSPTCPKQSGELDEYHFRVIDMLDDL